MNTSLKSKAVRKQMKIKSSEKQLNFLTEQEPEKIDVK